MRKLATALLAALVGGGCPPAAADPNTDFEGTATINGVVPQGQVAPMDDVLVMADTIQDDGDRLVVWQGIRRAGTRSAIHTHQYGGHTCVLSGTIVDLVEGMAPMTFPAGTCYYMPSNTPMSAANLGPGDVRLIDTFVLPPGAPTMTIIEPGWMDMDPDANG